MRIKNKKNWRRTFGFRCLRKTGLPTAFTLEPNETSIELPATLGLDVSCRNMAQRGEINVILNDNDKRFLGKEAVEALKPVKEKKVTPAIPAEVKKEEEEPVKVVIEEPVPEVSGPCEAAPEEEPETPDLPADEEPKGFTLPKPPSKMNKTEWLAIGMREDVGLKNEINPGMTKAKLQQAVMARLEELGLID